VTVLVADVVGSTELFGRLGEDRADEARRALFAAFREAVDSGGGVLVKTMGDGCLASFGGAADAVSAAVELQQRAALLRERTIAGLGLRVGLAVGDVTEEDGDVFGPAVVTASRLCDAAGEHQVLASETVRLLAGTRGGHRYEAAGELILKGIAEPVAACTVAVEAPTAVRPFPSALAQAPSEVVVGRDRELDVLVTAAKAAANGERRVVLLAGEPGVGKTRLAAALARKAHDDGAAVLFGRCEEDLAVAFQPFVEPLQAIWGDLDEDERRGHTSAHGGELARLVPSLGGPEPVRAEPDIEQARLFDAVADVLGRGAAARPIVLVLDDLHWAAPATVALVRHLLVGPADVRLLIVGTYRDTEIDRGHALGGLLSDAHRIAGVERLALRGLDATGIEDLFTRVSGDVLDDAGRNLAAAVAERTDGNPFFVNQILRHLVERQVLVQEGGRWVVQGALEEVDLPEGVLDVVGRRLSTLSPAANQALGVAALCGLSFSVRLLRAVPDAGDPDAVVDGLDEAVRARLLVETGPGHLSFTHAIVRDALLRELTSARAARLHRSLGEGLLEVYAGADVLPLAELAHHFTEAALLGDTASAARWAVAAADAAATQADHHGGIAVLERALVVIEAVEPVDQEARFDVAVSLAEAHYQLAMHHGPSVDAAADAARRLADGVRMLRLATARYPGSTGVLDPERLWLYDESLELLGEDQLPLRVLARAGRMGQRALQADNGFIEEIEPVLAELPAVDALAPRIGLLVKAWVCFATLGLPGAARRLALADERDCVDPTAIDPWYDALGTHVALETFQHGYRNQAAIGLGRRAEFADGIARLAAVGRLEGNRSALGMSEAQLALLALLDGRFDEALAHSQSMVDASPTEPNFLLSSFAHHNQVLREQGRAVEARAMLGPAADVSPDLAAVKAAFGLAAFEAGDPATAAGALDEVLERWRAWGRDWSWPVVLAASAELVVGLGRAEDASPLLEELDGYSGELAIVGAAVLCLGAYDRFRGMLLDLLGRHDEAVDALEAALDLERSADAATMTSRTRLWLARALRHRGAPGDLDRAQAELAEAIAAAGGLGQHGVLADARALLAEVGVESPGAGGAE
jgi:class 3 adenylate cyclase/tetratricopeptide (TPR) repeat protein